MTIPRDVRPGAIVEVHFWGKLIDQSLMDDERVIVERDGAYYALPAGAAFRMISPPDGTPREGDVWFDEVTKSLWLALLQGDTIIRFTPVNAEARRYARGMTFLPWHDVYSELPSLRLEWRANRPPDDESHHGSS